MKKYLNIILCLFMIFSLTGCKGKNGKLASKSKVFDKVEKEVPTEKYKYINVEKYEDESPKREIYHFKSNERDLTFDAINTLSEIDFDGGTGWYSDYIYINYSDKIKEYYEEDISPLFNNLSKDQYNKYYCTSYNNLEAYAKAISKADDIYKNELNYNTQEWMNENPYSTFTLYGSFNEEKEYADQYICSIDINGTLSYDFIYDYLTYSYIEAASEDKITDYTIPSDKLNSTVTRELESIWVDNVNLSEKSMEKAKEDGLYNRTEDAYHSKYYYDWQTYVIPLDVGLASKEYAPQWMRSYASAFGAKIKVSDDKGKIKWEYKEDTWTIEAKEDDGHVTSCIFKKNGKKQDIEYITYKDKRTTVHSTYIIGIRVEDFCSIFDLNYEVDDENQRLIFHQN